MSVETLSRPPVDSSEQPHADAGEQLTFDSLDTSPHIPEDRSVSEGEQLTIDGLDESGEEVPTFTDPKAQKRYDKARAAEAKIAPLTASLAEKRDATGNEDETNEERAARAGARLKKIGKAALRFGVKTIGVGVLVGEKVAQKGSVEWTRATLATRKKYVEHGKKAAARAETRAQSNMLTEAHAMNDRFTAEKVEDDHTEGLTMNKEFKDAQVAAAAPEAFAMNDTYNAEKRDADHAEGLIMDQERTDAMREEEIRRDIAKRDAEAALARRNSRPHRRVGRVIRGVGRAIRTEWNKTA
jgi:hypothetical protein